MFVTFSPSKALVMEEEVTVEEIVLRTFLFTFSSHVSFDTFCEATRLALISP